MSVALTSVPSKVPPAIVTVFPLATVSGVPVSPVISKLVNPPAGEAHVLSPLKNVVASAVPVADKSITPVVTAPVAAEFAVAADINVPLVLVKLVTPPPPEPVIVIVPLEEVTPTVPDPIIFTVSVPESPPPVPVNTTGVF